MAINDLGEMRERLAYHAESLETNLDSLEGWSLKAERNPDSLDTMQSLALQARVVVAARRRLRMTQGIVDRLERKAAAEKAAS